MPSGTEPTGTVATTSACAVSTTDTVSLPAFVTYRSFDERRVQYTRTLAVDAPRRRVSSHPPYDLSEPPLHLPR